MKRLMEDEYGLLKDVYHKQDIGGSVGEYKYIISASWWEKWVIYVNFDA